MRSGAKLSPVLIQVQDDQSPNRQWHILSFLLTLLGQTSNMTYMWPLMLGTSFTFLGVQLVLVSSVDQSENRWNCKCWIDSWGYTPEFNSQLSSLLSRHVLYNASNQRHLFWEWQLLSKNYV
jgi:hypothetical protein